MNSKYEKIIDLDHHVSKIHKPMAIADRAGQFAAFAALTGYEDMIKEFGIVFDEKIELSSQQIEDINHVLIALKVNDEVNVKIYRDNFYRLIVTKVLKIDEINKILYLEDDKIMFEEIISISINN